MAARLEKPPRRWTYDEYSKLDDNQRYENIGGNLLVAPAPDTWIGDAADKTLEILTLEDGQFSLHSSAEEKGRSPRNF